MSEERLGSGRWRRRGSRKKKKEKKKGGGRKEGREEGWRGAGGKRDRSVLESPESGGWTPA